MESTQMASQVMNRFNGTILCGRPLRISWGVHKNKFDQDNEKANNNQSSNINSVYVRFKTVKSGKIVNEEVLNSIFSTFGKISDCSVKSSTFHKLTGLQSGYAFVHFANSEDGIKSAMACVNSMKYVQTNGIIFQVEPSKNQLSLINKKYNNDNNIAQYVSAYSKPQDSHDNSNVNTTINANNYGFNNSININRQSQNYSQYPPHGPVHDVNAHSKNQNPLPNYRPYAHPDPNANRGVYNPTPGNYSYESNPPQVMFVQQNIPTSPTTFSNQYHQYNYMNTQVNPNNGHVALLPPSPERQMNRSGSDNSIPVFYNNNNNNSFIPSNQQVISNNYNNSTYPMRPLINANSNIEINQDNTNSHDNISTIQQSGI
eukprot:gene16901-22390_t